MLQQLCQSWWAQPAALDGGGCLVDASGDIILTSVPTKALPGHPSKPAYRPAFLASPKLAAGALGGASSSAWTPVLMSADGTDFILAFHNAPARAPVPPPSAADAATEEALERALGTSSPLADDCECVALISIPACKQDVLLLQGGSDGNLGSPLSPSSSWNRQGSSAAADAIKPCSPSGASRSSSCSLGGATLRKAGSGGGGLAGALSQAGGWWRQLSSASLNEVGTEEVADRHSREMRRVPYVGPAEGLASQSSRLG